MGKLLKVAIREASRAPMQVSEAGNITLEGGLDGDYRGKMEGRQVTLISREGWENACTDLGDEVPWTTRRSNLLVEGIDLAETSGATIQVGEAVLAVTAETVPCPRMEEARAGLQEALKPEWRGGVCCKVVKGGAIKAGDEVTVSA